MIRSNLKSGIAEILGAYDVTKTFGFGGISSSQVLENVTIGKTYIIMADRTISNIAGGDSEIFAPTKVGSTSNSSIAIVKATATTITFNTTETISCYAIELTPKA